MTQWTKKAAIVILAGATALTVGVAGGDIVSAVRIACDARNFALADREIQAYRAAVGVTPDLAEALSWLARGTLDNKQYDRADGYASETRRLAVDLLKRQGAGIPALETALGAAIEVHANVLAARGQRADAIAYLRSELAAWGRAPFAARIQKNINLLTMEGKPAPALDESQWIGARPVSLASLRGHPVLLFFWAHWCSDCKGEVPILARLMQAYGPKGLVLIGPTQLYGYTAEGEAGPEVERRYIEKIRLEYYGALGNMRVPLSSKNFQRYGCSTTPTLVLLDRNGVVRMYHPGAMPYDDLAAQIKRLSGVPAHPSL
ncbi:MAG TPA: TlpA disulfide reductase family protein [Bryobacteraceae bacterium]|nr:TlpA disulfide reductase family protein [Bryobacteraceae bacterium]